MNLWPHQANALDELLAALNWGEKRILVTSPTGGGKTVVAANLARDFLDRKKRVILYTNRRLLIEQFASVLTVHGFDFGIRAAGHAPDRGCPFQIASVQTEAARSMKGKEELFPADLVLVDEAHLQTGNTVQELQTYYAGLGAAWVGFTATPIDLGLLYSKLIVAGTNSELRQCGALVPCQMWGPDEPDLKAYKAELAAGKDLSEKKASSAMGGKSKHLFGRVFEWFEKLNPDHRPTILFAPGVDESMWFAEQFTERGIPAAHIDGKNVWVNGEQKPTTPERRQEILDGSRDGSIKVITNRYVMREGIDAPWLEHGIFATVFGSLQTYLQCLDSQTEILTARGFVGPDAIGDCDLVAAFDRHSDEITWQAITDRVDRTLQANESMFTVRGPSVDVRVSDQHNMVCKVRTTGAEGWRWPAVWSLKPASELANYWAFTIPVSGIQGAPGVPLTDSQLRFIGWFISDGTMNRSNRQVVISQAVHQPQLEDLRTCLIECGFDFHEYRITPKGFPNGKDQIRFSIPKGVRGKSLARNGWFPFAPYLDKELSPLFEDLTAQQLEVLLEAIHLGDGNKRKPSTWTPRSYHISTGNRVFADRLQSLCVRRGFRCSVSTEKPSIVSRKPRLTINIKKVATLHLAGSAQTERTVLKEVPSEEGERIWCVTNPLGTLVIRRNGKVCIVGNSGGRLLRASPGKKVATLQDHGGSWHRHGSLNADRSWNLDYTALMYAGIREDRFREKLELEPARCPQCAQIIGSVRPGTKCVCGHVFGTRKTRPVVMSDGEARELVGDVFQQRRVQMKPDTLSLWTKAFWQAMHSGRTFTQAYGYFAHQHKYWPPKTLKGMPKNAVDWYRLVKDVPRDQLI